MKIVFLLLAIASSAHCETLSPTQKLFIRHQARQGVRDFKADITSRQMNSLAERSDSALANMVARANMELTKAGDGEYATQSQALFDSVYRGYLTRMVEGRMQDIGDHKPLSEWLDNFYERIEFVLGVEFCKASHLSDIYTLNHTIPVVFHPCDFPMDSVTGSREDEYRRHFDQGAVYYGLVPVVTYWTVDIACMVGTEGTGIVFLCGLAGDAGEYLMAKFVAPKLSDMVFEKLCPGE